MTKEKIVSPANSWKGFALLKFIWLNKVKILAVLLAFGTAVSQQFPELGSAMAGMLILGEKLYKYYITEYNFSIN